MVEDVTYQPDRGDFIWLDFDPQSGTEQAGRRPALVVSPRDFNIATGLAAVCPITNTATGSKFEVPIPRGVSGRFVKVKTAKTKPRTHVVETIKR